MSVGDEAGLAQQPEQALTRFCSRLQSDSSFARRAAGGVKAILVDEFQDMNDGLFGAVLSLQRASDAGLTVIGDDDQDILRWNRRPRTSALPFFSRFRESFPDRLERTLTRNFRSTTAIVHRSQKFLDALPHRQEHRLKDGVKLLPVEGLEEGHVEEVSPNEFERRCTESLEKAQRAGRSLGSCAGQTPRRPTSIDGSGAAHRPCAC